jgi:hypothetical protein
VSTLKPFEPPSETPTCFRICFNRLRPIIALGSLLFFISSLCLGKLLCSGATPASAVPATLAKTIKKLVSSPGDEFFIVDLSHQIAEPGFQRPYGHPVRPEIDVEQRTSIPLLRVK